MNLTPELLNRKTPRMPRKSIIGLAIGALLAVTLNPTAAISAPAPKLLTAPTLPALAGTGTVVKAVAGKWSASASKSYAWTLDGKAVAHATSTSFKVSASQLGKMLRVVETAKFAGGKKLTATSKPLALGRILVIGKPVIGYTDDTNSALKVTALPQIQPAGAIIAYQWQHPPFAVPTTVNADTYPLATADEDNQVGVELTITAKGYLPTRVSSNGISIAKKNRVYQQIWSEDFNGAAGASYNSSTWGSQEGDGSAYRNRGWGNNEREWYLSSLATTDGNGNLTIDAKTDGANAFNCYYKAPCEWISSKLLTQDKVGFKYGRIEARIKASDGAGTWPAFWMLGSDISQWGWPGCGEIDITELLGKDPNTTYGTLHGPNSGGGGRGGSGAVDGGFANGYHTYAIDWLPDQITWYVDGVAYHTENKYDGDWVFDHEFFIILNLAMGGNFPGPVDPALTKAQLSVDWIHVSTINGIGEVITH